MDHHEGKEFVIPLENQPGYFADIATSLAQGAVNISGFAVDARGEYGLVRIVTDDPATAERVFQHTKQSYRINDVISVRVPHRPGELARLTQALAAGGVNVHAAYTTADKEGIAMLTFSVDDLHSARKILQ